MQMPCVASPLRLRYRCRHMADLDAARWTGHAHGLSTLRSLLSPGGRPVRTPTRCSRH